MAVFKCRMCGAPIEVEDNQTIVTCGYCGSVQTVTLSRDDAMINLFNRASQKCHLNTSD